MKLTISLNKTYPEGIEDKLGAKSYPHIIPPYVDKR